MLKISNQLLYDKIVLWFNENIATPLTPSKATKEFNCSIDDAFIHIFYLYIYGFKDVRISMRYHHYSKGEFHRVCGHKVRGLDQMGEPFNNPVTGENVTTDQVYFEFVNYPVLHLNLKRKWFDMISSGEKKEEYRTISQHWGRVFVNGKIKIKGVCYHPTDVIVCFSNGYSTNRDQIRVSLKGLKTSSGVEKWGAKKEEQYYTLQLEYLNP